MIQFSIHEVQHKVKEKNMPRPEIGQYMKTDDVIANWKAWHWTGLYLWLKPHVESLNKDQCRMLDDLRNVEHFVYIREAKRYYDSDYWKALRKRMTSAYPCIACGSTENLHLHHLHYNAIYEEDKNSIAVLCSRCHILVHPFQSMASRKDTEIRRTMELPRGKETYKNTVDGKQVYDLTVAKLLSKGEKS